MKSIIAALCGLLLSCSGARAQEDTPPIPFVTTPLEVAERMLAYGAVGADDFVIDLGSGDGRIVIAAAQRYGARGVGIELHRELVLRSRDNARAAGVADRASFVQGDVLDADLSRATVVTMYLLPWLMNRLQPTLLNLKPGTRIVAHTFTWTGWAPDRSETVRLTARHEGQGDISRIHLWIVPAKVRGEWRLLSAETSDAWRLRITQNYQKIDIEGSRGGRPLQFSEALLAGDEISWNAENGRFRGRMVGERIEGELLQSGSMLPLKLAFVRAGR